MDNSKAKILNELLHEIEEKEFDLEAWKMKAIMVFKLFFSPEDEKIGFIKNLQYNYSSWTLRDSVGGKQPDSVKENARRVIETALLEITLSGKELNFVLDIIKDEVTGKEFSALIEIIEKSEGVAADLTEYFNNLATSKKEQLLTKLVLKSIKK